MEDHATLDLLILVAMATVFGLALVAEALSNRFVASAPMLALTAGLLAGPSVLGLVRLEELTGDVMVLLEELARVTLAVAIMAATLRVGWDWVRNHLRDLLVILLAGLPMMWGLSVAALLATLPVGFAVALMLGAVLTPTDPVLAQAVVTSSEAERKVPGALRHLISAESAANDGLAFLLVMPCVLFLQHGAVPTAAEFGRLVLWEVLAALLLGLAIGWAAGRLMRATSGRWATEVGLVAGSVALAFVALTGLRLLGMDGLFGVFGAGLGVSAALGEEHQARHATFNHVLADLFQLPLIVVIGMALPVADWLAVGWPLAACVALILVFRRLPVLLALRPLLRTVGDRPSAIFAGWFGPIGVAALFYAATALKGTGNGLVFPVATATIAGSILAHGLTDTVGSRLFGDVRSRRRQPAG